VPAELLHALLPELLVLALLLALMVLEMARAGAAWGRVLFGTVMLVALGITLQQAGAGYAVAIVPGELQIDRFALYGKAVVLACGFGVAVAFGDPDDFKFWMLLASALLGSLLILDSAGFAVLFIGLELLSLPVFALMVLGRGQSNAAEGAFKYLLMSSVGTALFLFGVALAYGITGSLGIARFSAALADGGAQMQAAALLVLCGLFLKAAVFPFHAWAPDAYASARLPVTAAMASAVKAAAALALVRVFGTAPLPAAAAVAVVVLAIASIVFGNLAALAQTRFRRLLAYSSIAHAGYMAFVLADTTGGRATDLLWYAGIYALTTLLACAALARLAPGEDDRLEALDGAFARRPAAALLLAFAMLSLAGLPPFPGFFAKLLVFRSVIASGELVPAILAFAGSFLGLAYYLGIVLRLFRSDPARVTAHAVKRVAEDEIAA
jgi:NADH-quinone oxidoreductase subunit N